ncbi:MAG: Gfo/Idh/MocA family oxidoreductase, partial [Actinobacteria bacterium]|nr:Gfo/Idh/MocA family oxidoreductase [Actinomycetota bacterium]NIV58054.1 Gfo/Idh/MocA family oxidoreductase [Actinomycetota bacterium]NIX52828.1 Gfo/Idh/MocA family oxidoreductase [Actinomycetota bacterium]
MIGYGVIGTGMMGLEHIYNVLHLEGATVTAVSDPDEGSRAKGREAAGLPKDAAFADHRDLIASERCDAVVVASPNYTHAAILDDVLATDLHILVEKPLCTTVDDCRRVADAAAARTPVTWMALEYRYMAPIARLLTEVRNGAAGTVQMVAIREHRFPFLEKVGDWNRLRRNTGGTLVEK